jgi:MYXO-CTERM domain-containing protein
MPEETPLHGMSLIFQSTPEQAAAAAVLKNDIENVGSPGYHHWITPEQYGSSFGPSRAQVARATAWLQKEGFEVHGASKNGMRLFFSGTVGQLEKSFQTEMHRYNVKGDEHFALSTQPTYASELGPVLGMRGTHNFHPKPSPKRRALAKVQRHITPEYVLPLPDDGGEGLPSTGGVDSWLTLAPADFSAIYDTNPLYADSIDGTGETIAIIAQFSNFYDDDIAAFRKTFLPAKYWSNVPTRDFVSYSGNPNVYDADYLGEAELDLEWSGAVAPGATIKYVFTGDNEVYSVFDAVAYAVDQNYKLISMSYGECESYYTPSDVLFVSTLGDSAAMQGTTLVVSSGDQGSTDCESEDETTAVDGESVDFPGSIPSVTDVGGTMFDFGGPPPPSFVFQTDAGYTAKSPYPILEDGGVGDAGPENPADFARYWTCSGEAPSIACAASGYIPERAWNELALNQYAYQTFAMEDDFWGATGGGQSVLYPAPYWQTSIPSNTGWRQVPDVALSAALYQVGYTIEASSPEDAGPGATTEGPVGPNFYGGTSCGAPSFSGILALVSQKVRTSNTAAPAGLGTINPILYALNAGSAGHSIFHDVVTGDNNVPCGPGTPGCPADGGVEGFSAGPGYDMVTGLGSVDATQLANNWATLAPTATTMTGAASASDGVPFEVHASVTTTTSGSEALTGDVLFYAVGYGAELPDGGPLPESSLLAEVPVTAGAGGTASASTTLLLPAGRSGSSQVRAFYAGDGHHLASWSPATSVNVWTNFAIVTGSGLTCVSNGCTLTLAPNQQFTFESTGGVQPIVWYDWIDTTNYGNLESLTATSAVLQAGPSDGTIILIGGDNDGATFRIVVNVVGEAIDGGTLPPPWDGGGIDGAIPIEPDAGNVASSDGGSDGGSGSSSGGGSGGSSGSSSGGSSGGGSGGSSGSSSGGSSSGGSGGSSGSSSGASDGGSGGSSGSSSGGSSDADDAGLEAGTASSGGSSNSGCGCVTAGQEPSRSAPGSAVAAIALGLALARRRRRR